MLLTVAALTAWPRSAAADITAFIGITPTPESRTLRGTAFGFGLLIVAFEFEYANTVEDSLAGLPGLQTGSANVLLQTPIDIARMQFYGTGGAGLYRERLGTTQETSYGTNVGGGAKIRLVGPLKVRLDYRIFRLEGNPLHQTYQRFYAGANLSF
jgi:hypothetical protein